MYLNVSLIAGLPDGTTPKTPEILNSLISLTSPPSPPSYAHLPQHVQGGTAELLSPDCSTPGDECGGGGWGGVGDTTGVGGGCIGVESSSCNRLSILQPQHHQQPQQQQHFSSSTQLTPTSDGSPPPPPSMLPTSCQAPELPSPIRTIEATRSALIKEGLKIQITSKLHKNGVCTASVYSFSNKVIKTELTREDEERRRRRRERNKLAATKCRNKKKEQTVILMSESETVEEINARLKGEVQRLTGEKDKLEQLLDDVRHRSTCKMPRLTKNSTPSKILATQPGNTSPSYVPSNASPLSTSSSSSSCCSSSSSCSFTSLLSPSDSKEFITTLTPSTSASESSADVSNVTSTTGSLEYIEPTIPLDTASTTKLLSSKCKASSRFHPYMYTGHHSTHGSVRHDLSSANNNYPSTSQVATSRYNESSALDTREYTNKYSCAANNGCEDIKVNPFRYPILPINSSEAPHEQQHEFTPPEVPISREDYRGCRPTVTLTHYSPNYCLTQRPTEALLPIDAVIPVSGQYGALPSITQHHNLFNSPCTYSNL